MNAVSFKPKKDVQDYLFDDFNTKLYWRLLEDHPNDKYYEPLSFFNQLYECLEIVKANKEKPIDVTSHLKTMLFSKPITQSKYDATKFMLWYLTELVHIYSGFSQHHQNLEHPKDHMLKTCYEFILRLFNQMSLDEYPFEREPYTEEEIAEKEKGFEWDFWVHKEIADAINDPKQKLEYLVNKKADYLIIFGNGGSALDFAAQCEAEINRIKELAKVIGQQKTDSSLKSIWMPEAKISFQEFLQAGIDKGIWNEQYQIITKKGGLYSTGKDLLGSLFVALKGFAISENIDYKVAGKAFCEFFHIMIKEHTKEPYKAFSSGNQKIIKELRRAFGIK